MRLIDANYVEDYLRERIAKDEHRFPGRKLIGRLEERYDLLFLITNLPAVPIVQRAGNSDHEKGGNNMSRLHSCAKCNWCQPVTDSEGDIEYICVNRQSGSFLQEVALYSEDCELDDFGERLWCEEHGVEYQEDE